MFSGRIPSCVFVGVVIAIELRVTLHFHLHLNFACLLFSTPNAVASTPRLPLVPKFALISTPSFALTLP